MEEIKDERGYERETQKGENLAWYLPNSKPDYYRKIKKMSKIKAIEKLNEDRYLAFQAEEPKWFSLPRVGVVAYENKMWLYIHFYLFKKSYYFTPLGRWNY